MAFLAALGSMFGGATGGSIMGSVFSSILGGLSSSASAKMDVKMLSEKGKQDRKTVGYEAQLIDYMKQKDNYQTFKALDQYSQFSKVNQFAPNFNRTYQGPTDPGAMPGPGG